MCYEQRGGQRNALDIHQLVWRVQSLEDGKYLWPWDTCLVHILHVSRTWLRLYAHWNHKRAIKMDLNQLSCDALNKAMDR